MRIDIGGPWFDDLKVGDVYDDAPGMTITAGHVASYQSTVGDRSRLPLDATLSLAVTGHAAQLVPHGLVCAIAIGQTTVVTQRVRANLFYRGLIQMRPVYVGDTIRTRTEVVALKQNSARPDRPATGLAVLRMTVTNQHGSRVLDFYRCPMIPLREQDAVTGHADDVASIPADLDMDDLVDAIPPWSFGRFRDLVPGHHERDIREGVTYVVEHRDPVGAAPELARMTLNMAEAHLDEDASPYGRRLVFGGHTIAIAAAQMVRAIPDLMTVLAWRSCEHLGPVFEGDMLRTDVDVDAITSVDGEARLVDLRARTFAARSDGEQPVLDWRLVGLLA